MCTVSYVYNKGVVIITSNRDEKVIRPNAIPPKNYTRKGKHILYPKDQKAGGTWFVVDANGTVLVLLNGGITKHEVKLPYRKSRGLIALDIICSASPKDFWIQIHLENIEPFTLVLFQDKKLYELIWDGSEKRMTQLKETQNYIWSSVTLYPEEIRKHRSNWFTEFLKNREEVSPLEMLDFHRNTQEDDTENGLIINRNNNMKTVSVTQAVIDRNKGVIDYYDLIAQKEFSTGFITI